MKPDHAAIYARGAERYERLIAREDADGNLPKALAEIRSWAGLDVVDLGAGTGRLTRLMAPAARSVRAFDASPAMLAVARIAIRDVVRGHPRPEEVDVTFAVADHRSLPIPDASCDLVVAGWSLCYAALEKPEAPRAGLDPALAEIDRILRPGGAAIVIETLGTGVEQPRRSDEMKAYLDALDALGFASTWVRTDYRFTSNAEAVELVGFFFGDERADALAASGGVTVPECTGIWWRTFPPAQVAVPPTIG